MKIIFYMPRWLYVIFFTTEARGNFHHRGTEARSFFYHREHGGARRFFINEVLVSQNFFLCVFVSWWLRFFHHGGTKARGNFHHRGTESTVCFTTETQRHGVFFTTEVLNLINYFYCVL